MQMWLKNCTPPDLARLLSATRHVIAASPRATRSLVFAVCTVVRALSEVVARSLPREESRPQVVSPSCKESTGASNVRVARGHAEGRGLAPMGMWT